MSKTGGGGGGGQQIRISVGEITFVWVIKIQSPHSENVSVEQQGKEQDWRDLKRECKKRNVEVSYVYTKLPRSQTSLQVFQPFQKMEFFSSLFCMVIQPQKPLLSFFLQLNTVPRYVLLTQSGRAIRLPVLETVSVTVV